jgi:hypothetical protein
MITKDMIQQNTINQIKRRLRKELGRNYAEFVELMKKMSGVLIRQFIAQCLLGEEWPQICITMCITYKSHKEHGDKLNKFFINNKYEYHKQKRACYDNVNRKTSISALLYQKTEICVVIYMLPKIETNSVKAQIYIDSISKIPPEVRAFVCEYSEYDCSKNMYSFASNELYVDRMNEIFVKVTNVARFDRLHADFHMICGNGFKFYRPRTKKIMANDDILRSFFNIIKVQKKDDYGNKTFRRTLIIKDNMIFFKRGHVLIFDIVEMTFRDNRNKNSSDLLSLSRCHSPEECVVVKLTYPHTAHYHGRYMLPESSSNNESDNIDNSVILIVQKEC